MNYYVRTYELSSGRAKWFASEREAREAARRLSLRKGPKSRNGRPYSYVVVFVRNVGDGKERIARYKNGEEVS